LNKLPTDLVPPLLQKSTESIETKHKPPQLDIGLGRQERANPRKDREAALTF